MQENLNSENRQKWAENRHKNTTQTPSNALEQVKTPSGVFFFVHFYINFHRFDWCLVFPSPWNSSFITASPLVNPIRRLMYVKKQVQWLVTDNKDRLQKLSTSEGYKKQTLASYARKTREMAQSTQVLLFIQIHLRLPGTALFLGLG